MMVRHAENIGLDGRHGTIAVVAKGAPHHFLDLRDLSYKFWFEIYKKYNKLGTETQSILTSCEGNALVRIVVKEAIGVLQDIIKLLGDDGGKSWPRRSPFWGFSVTPHHRCTGRHPMDRRTLDLNFEYGNLKRKPDLEYYNLYYQPIE